MRLCGTCGANSSPTTEFTDCPSRDSKLWRLRIEQPNANWPPPSKPFADPWHWRDSQAHTIQVRKHGLQDVRHCVTETFCVCADGWLSCGSLLSPASGDVYNEIRQALKMLHAFIENRCGEVTRSIHNLEVIPRTRGIEATIAAGKLPCFVDEPQVLLQCCEHQFPSKTPDIRRSCFFTVVKSLTLVCKGPLMTGTGVRMAHATSEIAQFPRSLGAVVPTSSDQ